MSCSQYFLCYLRELGSLFGTILGTTHAKLQEGPMSTVKGPAS